MSRLHDAVIRPAKPGERQQRGIDYNHGVSPTVVEDAPIESTEELSAPEVEEPAVEKPAKKPAKKSSKK